MHQRLLVLVDIEEADTPQEAISVIESYLIDNRFVSDETRFCNPPADYYSIGGRWSGFLSPAMEKFSEIERTGLEPDELQQKWMALGGIGVQPGKRSIFSYSGADDVMILSSFHKRLLDESDYEGLESFIDINSDCTTWEDVVEGYIGKKWIALIDYHY